MPHANLDTHMKAQSAATKALMDREAAAGSLAAKIRASTHPERGLGLSELGALIGVSRESLQKCVQQGRFLSLPERPDALSQREAFRALQGYLPRAVGWKSVAALADELELHRNQVVSIAARVAPPQALLYALDERLYISPDGEQLVREERARLTELVKRERLCDVARRLHLRPNQATAFFSARQISLDCDYNGHARLSDTQVALITEWRNRVTEVRRHRDRSIDGVTHRSVIRVAQEKAELFAPPGSTRYERIVARELTNLYYFVRNAGVAVRAACLARIPLVRNPGLAAKAQE